MPPLTYLQMANSPMTVSGCQWFLQSLIKNDVSVENIDMTVFFFSITWQRRFWNFTIVTDCDM